jgi:hypothetical protein
MVEWATMCQPREHRGLRILKTKYMNIALMLRWIWKIYQNKEGLWADLLRARYLGDGDHIFCKCHLAKFMWAGVGELLKCKWNPMAVRDFVSIVQGLSWWMYRLAWFTFAAQS